MYPTFSNVFDAYNWNLWFSISDGNFKGQSDIGPFTEQKLKYLS